MAVISPYSPVGGGRDRALTRVAALLGGGFAVAAAVIALVVPSGAPAPPTRATVSVVAASGSVAGAGADASGVRSGPVRNASVTRVVCTRMVSDPRALHAALLAEADSATTVFCVRGSGGRPVAVNAVAFARAALGTPYVWGGNGAPDGGFDCSGLTTAAYASAGLRLPRTAQTQFNAVPKLAPGAQPTAGDLVFFGTGPRRVTHVGIAVSATEMVNAPQPGEVVKISPLHRKDLVGIGRPSAMPGADQSGTD
jgi:cell wall-associated NlpC family hydrolase